MALEEKKKSFKGVQLFQMPRLTFDIFNYKTSEDHAELCVPISVTPIFLVTYLTEVKIKKSLANGKFSCDLL